MMFIGDKEISAIFSKRYRPSGKILVKTTWWSNVVYTNDDGYYIVDRRYKDIPTVKLWNRNQTNKTTQRWTENIGFWVKGTINNAIVIYDDFANKNGIKTPDNVRTWVFSGSDYGGAPLLHNKAFTSYSYFYPAIASKNKKNFGSKSAKTGILALSPLMDLITSVTLTHKNLPDIIIGTKGKNTKQIYAMVFHETAYYSHKNQVSNGFWANVQYQAMFDKTKGTYGDGSPIYSSYTGVAEAWSNFIEYQMMTNNNLLGKGEYSINMTAYTNRSMTF